MTNVTLALRGIRGESAADIARRVLSITGSDKAALQALMLDDAELAQILTDAEAARDGAEADAVQTALDRIATAADRAQTALDRVATAADVVAAEADRVATAADRVVTTADRVQTGLDRVQTAADRVQTGLDRTAAAASVAWTTDVYAKLYNAQYAYTTAAAYSSSPPASPVAGERMVWLFDPNPLNNVWFEYNGTTWVEKSAKENSRWVKSRVPSLAHSPDFELWKPNWNSGYNNDGLYGGLKLDIDADGVTNYNPGSDFINVSIDGQRRFRVNNGNGLTYMSLGSNNTTYLGMGHNGDGVMTLFSKEYAVSGNPGVMAFLGWSGTVGEVVEVNFTGTNRVHLHSAGSFVTSSQNGRNEREGYGSDRVQYIGYEIASSTGKTIDFNNTGQTAYPGRLVSISTTQSSQKLLQFNSLSGSTYTELGFFNGTGVGYLPSLYVDRVLNPVLGMHSTVLGTPKISFGGNAATTLAERGLIDFNVNSGQMRIGSTHASYWVDIITANTVRMTFEDNGNLGFGLKSYGGGVRVISETNATTVPTSNPTGGIIRYAEGGAAKVRTPGGNIVTYAPNTRISVTGSRSSGAAWASLLAAMVSLGYVSDDTTA